MGTAISLRLRKNGPQARGLHPYRPVFIERHGFGDRRGDQKKLFQLEAEFGRQSFRRDLAAFRGPLQSVVNFLNEPLDLDGGPCGDFLLQERQLLAALLIAEIDFKNAACD